MEPYNTLKIEKVGGVSEGTKHNGMNEIKGIRKEEEGCIKKEKQIPTHFDVLRCVDPFLGKDLETNNEYSRYYATDKSTNGCF
jgi:hypothetical protein